MIEMSEGAACLSCRDCDIGGTVAGKNKADCLPFWFFEDRKHIHELVDAIFDDKFEPADIVDAPTKQQSGKRTRKHSGGK
jgi:hypothetical protein